MNNRHYRLRLAAEATLSAATQHLGDNAKFVTTEVQKILMAGQEAVVVLVSLNYDQDEEDLLGTALNRR